MQIFNLEFNTGFKRTLLAFAAISIFSVSQALPAYAEDTMPEKRFSLGGGLGVTQLAGSSQAFVSAGLEFEYRVTSLIGLGAFSNYVFASPGVGIVGLPQVYIHPLGGDWYINVAPMAQFGGGADTRFGARVGTRIPLQLGSAMIIPQVSVDFIGGGQNWMYGLGVAI
jgi:hypothetical protein